MEQRTRSDITLTASVDSGTRRASIYVDGNVHTQTIDGFSGHFKTDVRGTHHSISRKWLLGYLNEWVWKWNRRDDDEAMFRQLIRSAAT